MKKSLVIHQPNFLPYLGFFEQLNQADVYIAFDDVQFTKNEFQNRNFIKCDYGKTNLTIPVRIKKRFGQLIKDVEIADRKWLTKLFNKLDACYRYAPNFDEVITFLSNTLDERKKYLIDVNLPLIKQITIRMNIPVKIIRSSSLSIEFSDRTERLIEMMKAVGAERLIGGPGTASYIDNDKIIEEGFEFKAHQFVPTEYPQLFGDFVPYLSVIDYIMNVGWNLQEKP